MMTPHEKINRRISKIDEWIRKNRLKKSHSTPYIVLNQFLEHCTICHSKDEVSVALFDLSLMDYEISGLYLVNHRPEKAIYIELKKKDQTTKSIDADFVETVLSWCD